VKTGTARRVSLPLSHDAGLSQVQVSSVAGTKTAQDTVGLKKLQLLAYDGTHFLKQFFTAEWLLNEVNAT